MVFNIILYNYVDPNFSILLQEATIEKSIELMQGFASESAMEEMITALENQDSFSPRSLAPLDMVLIKCSLSLIIAAFLKKVRLMRLYNIYEYIRCCSVYNEYESLPELCSWIDRVMNSNNFSYEVIIIDDGSTDNTWEVISKLSSDFESIKGIKFRRNYGKSAALNVGFENANGDVVITMDADLQDSPDEIPELYSMIINDGYDMVSGWKQKRYDPLTKTISKSYTIGQQEKHQEFIYMILTVV